MNNKLVSLGELIVDFASVGSDSLKNTTEFKKNAGGAPANVCAQAVKLGQRAVYLTQVGDNAFGDFLIESLQNVGIDVSHILKSSSYDTSLAFVSFKENGEREFTFYRRTAADLYFDADSFKDVEIESGDVFEFGSVALKTEQARSAHDYLIEKSRAAGAIVAFDPNLRFNLWENADELREVVLRYAAKSDVMKIGDDELAFVTGCTEAEEGIKRLFSLGVKVVLYTKGSLGADAYLSDGRVFRQEGYKVKSVDTTGAGDSSFGGFISCLLRDGITPSALLGKDVDYADYLKTACQCGAYTTTGYGAIASMATKEQLLKGENKLWHK